MQFEQSPGVSAIADGCHWHKVLQAVPPGRPIPGRLGLPARASFLGRCSSLLQALFPAWLARQTTETLN